MGCNRANARQQRTVSSGRQGLGSVRGPCVVQVNGWRPGRACSEDKLDYLGVRLKLSITLKARLGSRRGLAAGFAEGLLKECVTRRNIETQD